MSKDPKKVAIGKKSRNKGKVGERELANLLKTYGYDTRRGEQFCGLKGDADVVGVPGMHIECKRVQKLNIEDALVQSERDAREGEIPVVMHRRDREHWKVTLRLDKFMEIWNESKKEERIAEKDAEDVQAEKGRYDCQGC